MKIFFISILFLLSSFYIQAQTKVLTATTLYSHNATLYYSCSFCDQNWIIIDTICNTSIQFDLTNRKVRFIEANKTKLMIILDESTSKIRDIDKDGIKLIGHRPNMDKVELYVYTNRDTIKAVKYNQLDFTNKEGLPNKLLERVNYVINYKDSFSLITKLLDVKAPDVSKKVDPNIKEYTIVATEFNKYEYDDYTGWKSYPIHYEKHMTMDLKNKLITVLDENHETTNYWVDETIGGIGNGLQPKITKKCHDKDGKRVIIEIDYNEPSMTLIRPQKVKVYYKLYDMKN